MFRYKTHIEENSLYNTPPCFAIYIMMLVTRWIQKVGLETSSTGRTSAKAGEALRRDRRLGKFYKGTAVKECRSDMNVTFRLPTEALEETLRQGGLEAGMKGLKGHRSVGGIRASIYNAFPVEGVDALVSFMKDFEKKNG